MGVKLKSPNNNDRVNKMSTTGVQYYDFFTIMTFVNKLLEVGMMKRWILLAMCAFMAFTLIPQSTGAIAEESFLLTANGGCGYNQLSWTAVTGADRYWIYRGTGPGLEEKQPLTDFPIKETSYKDETGIENGK